MPNIVSINIVNYLLLFKGVLNWNLVKQFLMTKVIFLVSHMDSRVFWLLNTSVGTTYTIGYLWYYNNKTLQSSTNLSGKTQLLYKAEYKFYIEQTKSSLITLKKNSLSLGDPRMLLRRWQLKQALKNKQDFKRHI